MTGRHPRSSDSSFVPAASCTYCGKLSYSSRKEARAAARRLYPGEHMSPYVCRDGGTGWHVGHLGETVISGQLTREQRFGWPH